MFKTAFLGVVLIASIVLMNMPVVGATNNRGRNPKGNNGVVKISDEAGHNGIPENHPHVDCSFFVEFYNYDKNNNYADVNFKMHAPTNSGAHDLTVVKGDTSPFIGSDEALGGTDLDARVEYKLNFTGEPHHKQGYHVKLTVNAPGSKGSNKKHKVFWVKPCARVLSETTPEEKVAEEEFTPQTLSTNTVKQEEAARSVKGVKLLPATGFGASPAMIVSAFTTIFGYSLHRLFGKQS